MNDAEKKLDFEKRCKSAQAEITAVLAKYGLTMIPTITVQEVPRAGIKPIIEPPPGIVLPGDITPEHLRDVMGDDLSRPGDPL